VNGNYPGLVKLTHLAGLMSSSLSGSSHRCC